MNLFFDIIIMKHTIENYKTFWTESDIEEFEKDETNIKLKSLINTTNFESISDIFVEYIEKWITKNGIGRKLLREDNLRGQSYLEDSDIKKESSRMNKIDVLEKISFSSKNREQQDSDVFNTFGVRVDNLEIYSSVVASAIEYQLLEDNYIINLLKENTATVIEQVGSFNPKILFKAIAELCANGFLPRYLILDVRNYIELFTKVGANNLGVSSLLEVFKTKKYGCFEGIEIFVVNDNEPVILMTASPEYVGVYRTFDKNSPTAVKCKYEHDTNEEESTKTWVIESNVEACIINKDAIVNIELT